MSRSYRIDEWGCRCPPDRDSAAGGVTSKPSFLNSGVIPLLLPLLPQEENVLVVYQKPLVRPHRMAYPFVGEAVSSGLVDAFCAWF